MAHRPADDRVPAKKRKKASAACERWREERIFPPTHARSSTVVTRELRGWKNAVLGGREEFEDEHPLLLAQRGRSGWCMYG